MQKPCLQNNGHNLQSTSIDFSHPNNRAQFINISICGKTHRSRPEKFSKWRYDIWLLIHWWVAFLTHFKSALLHNFIIVTSQQLALGLSYFPCFKISNLYSSKHYRHMEFWGDFLRAFFTSVADFSESDFADYGWRWKALVPLIQCTLAILFTII